jgi:DNA-binding PadR family transcriptional regulator
MTPFDHLKKSNTTDNLWLYILYLAKKEPVWAYNLRSQIEKNFKFKPGMVSAYRVLYRLEVDGFVESQQEGRRRVYKITKKGEEELKKAINFFEETKEKLE